MTGDGVPPPPAPAGGLLARRRAARLQRRRDQLMSRAFCEGADARHAGRRCRPPSGLHVEVGMDLPGEWVAGWATVDRQLFREAAEAAGITAPARSTTARPSGRQQPA